MSRKSAAMAALVVAGWSFPGVFVRLMPQLGPWAIAVMRLSLGFVALLPIALLPIYRQSFLDALRQPVCWAVSALMFGYYLMATAGFQHAPVGEVALIISASPALALPIRWALGTRPTNNELIGTLFALGGVSCILPQSVSHKAFPSPVLGPVCALGAALCAALFTTCVSRLTKAGHPGSPLALATLSQAWGLLCLPFVLALTPIAPIQDHRTLWMLPLGFLCTAVPTAGYAAVAGRLSPIVATMLNPMVSVSATIVAALAIGEVPSLWVIPGGALICAGIAFASRARALPAPVAVDRRPIAPRIRRPLFDPARDKLFSISRPGQHTRSHPGVSARSSESPG